jgi:hypothetical protein
VITHKLERGLFDTGSFHCGAHSVPQPSRSPALLFCAGKAGLRGESGSTPRRPVQSCSGLCSRASQRSRLLDCGTAGLCGERRDGLFRFSPRSLLASSAQRRTAEKPSDWPSNTLPRKLISVLPESGLNRIIDFTATTALRATRGLPAYASRSTRISTTKHATCPLKDIACTKPSKNQLP